MDNSLWNGIIEKLPGAHFLQTVEWAEVKVGAGWQPFYAIWRVDGSWQIVTDVKNIKGAQANIRAAALILKRSIPIRGLAARVSVLYIPKGPLLNWQDDVLRARVLNDLQTLAKKYGAIFIKIDPDVQLGIGIPGSPQAVEDAGGKSIAAGLSRRGWRYSRDQIQFRNTVTLDLTPTEEEMLARMKQKTRYNVRLGPKKGVSVRAGELEDLPMLYKMYAETSVRDGFVIRDQAYYQRVWQIFMRQGMAEPLIAEVEGEAVAAVFLFWFARRAYYIYGMSREAHREKMPNYFLQWEAMRRAKEKGCAVYDLWGAPEVFDESDSLWGVFRFKEGLGGEVLRTLGAWDYAPNRILYNLYTDLMPRVLNFMRARGRRHTKNLLND